MSSPPRPEVDLHTHTVASGHAYCTITELSRAAAEKGLKGLGMTDHGPALPGGPHFYHFAALRFIPPTLNGVRILRGIEANILEGGQIDLAEPIRQRLDLVMAGFHDGCGFDHRGAKENTRAMVALMESKKVHVITHPGNPIFPVDFVAITKAAAETGTALEINNASFHISRRGSAPHCEAMAKLCARYDVPIAIGSDAHFSDGVGDFNYALQAVREAGIAPERIINRTLATTLAFLGLED